MCHWVRFQENAAVIFKSGSMTGPEREVAEHVSASRQDKQAHYGGR